MIQYIEGNIFDSPAQVLVNTVNTVGVMGKGIALSFKQRYPDMFESDRKACEKKQLTIGKLMLVNEPDYMILLFPTKESCRTPSKLEYIEKGLKKFVSAYADRHIYSIAFPRLGCGNGELSWKDVQPLMEKYLKHLPIDIYIYLGLTSGTIPEHRQQKKTMEWLKENAKDLSFNGVRDDIIISSRLLPYEFLANTKTVSVSYDNGLHFQVAGESEFFIGDEEFYQLWDDIRQSSIVKKSGGDADYVYALLSSMGYLAPIRIYDSVAKEYQQGYQINEGIGRRFLFEGERP